MAAVLLGVLLLGGTVMSTECWEALAIELMVRKKEGGRGERGQGVKRESSYLSATTPQLVVGGEKNDGSGREGVQYEMALGDSGAETR